MNTQSSLLVEEDSTVFGASHDPRIKRISASQQIHGALRDRIVSLEFVPGQGLSRTEIAGYYGVSQTPVRDAMLKLEEEGLLIIFPQSRTEVSKIDLDQARETQFLRLSLELEVTRCLARDTRKDRLATARKVLSMQEAALAAGDLGRFARLDKLFHGALCEAAGVRNLWRIINSHSGHIDRLRNLNLPNPGKTANILDYHNQILDKIEAADTAAVEKTVREHLSGTLAAVDQIIARHPDYF
ncbi:GntR family transcriptional regulator [Hoeflea sp.]|uniref:GntR family transcriptional regulator n=1 Tax=Hoeflea sp. TaxID=1940281 RepID=UPI003A92F189